jgi:hypothetical protein
MIRRLASIALASLAISAPASAELISIGNDTYLTMTDDGAAITIELDHVDQVGDRWMVLGVVEKPGATYEESGAWVRCQDNLIQHSGGEWQAVDHRTVNGYIWDVACR